MKATCILFIMSIVIFSCSEDDEMKDRQPEVNPDLSEALLLKQGMLEGVNHTVTGSVSIYEKDQFLYVVLDPFMSQSGPDLKVYLSKDVTASEYLRLGNLISLSGAQTYSIPAGYSIQNYGYVHIWCEKFSVEFARAQIK